MAIAPGSKDLARALDLILQPLLVEALVAIGEGKALEDALPGSIDTDQLGAALRRLVAIRAVEPSAGRLLGHHTLTSRGTRLLQLVDDLAAAVARTERVAHGSHSIFHWPHHRSCGTKDPSMAAYRSHWHFGA